MVWGAVAGAVGNLVGGRRDMMFNKKEADRARDWSKDMASTEMQRRVADLRAAGLNPMLAYSDAASTPGAAVANTSNPDLGSAMERGMAISSAKAEIERTKAETRRVNAEAQLIEAKVPYSATNAETESNTLKREMEKVGVEVDKLINETDKSMTDAQMARELLPWVVKMKELEVKGAEYGMSAKEAESKFFQQIGEGSRWAQLIRDLLIGIRSMR